MNGQKARDLVAVAAVGLAFGYALSRVGFSSWDRVHEMFTFHSLDLMIAFMVALGVLAPAWVITRKLSAPRWMPRPIHRGTLAGGFLFGVGWAISGSCPSIAAVQLGEGQLGGLLTIAGIFAGNYLYSRVHERWFRWSTHSCAED